MIELNMKFNRSDLFNKEPLHKCYSNACISVIVRSLSMLSMYSMFKNRRNYRLTGNVSNNISFYCKCHYAGIYYNKKLDDQLFVKRRGLDYDFLYKEELSFEKGEFDEEVSYNFPDHADTTINSYYWSDI